MGGVGLLWRCERCRRLIVGRCSIRTMVLRLGQGASVGECAVSPLGCVVASLCSKGRG